MNRIPQHSATFRNGLRNGLRNASATVSATIAATVRNASATVRNTHLYTTYISPPPFERLGGLFAYVTALLRRVAPSRTDSRIISQRYRGSFPVGAVWGVAELATFSSFKFFPNCDSKVQHAK